MSDFKIERGIPVPTGSGTGKPFKYPWPDMQPGDSVFIPATHSQGAKNARTAAAKWGKRTGRTFLTRKTCVDGVSGMRVWRVS